jgi:hypothetical protein
LLSLVPLLREDLFGHFGRGLTRSDTIRYILFKLMSQMCQLLSDKHGQCALRDCLLDNRWGSEDVYPPPSGPTVHVKSLRDPISDVTLMGVIPARVPLSLQVTQGLDQSCLFEPARLSPVEVRLDVPLIDGTLVQQIISDPYLDPFPAELPSNSRPLMTVNEYIVGRDLNRKV